MIKKKRKRRVPSNFAEDQPARMCGVSCLCVNSHPALPRPLLSFAKGRWPCHCGQFIQHVKDRQIKQSTCNFFIFKLFWKIPCNFFSQNLFSVKTKIQTTTGQFVTLKQASCTALMAPFASDMSILRNFCNGNWELAKPGTKLRLSKHCHHQKLSSNGSIQGREAFASCWAKVTADG